MIHSADGPFVSRELLAPHATRSLLQRVYLPTNSLQPCEALLSHKEDALNEPADCPPLSVITQQSDVAVPRTCRRARLAASPRNSFRSYQTQATSGPAAH
jgi:hypothetical protein